jgi:ABC-type Fe3+ transport system substrate-binding protein
MTRSLTHHGFRLTAGVLGIGALALAGCSSPASSTTVAASSSSKVPLVVYSAQGYDHAMTAAFQKATGIPVKLDDNSTGPLLTLMAALVYSKAKLPDPPTTWQQLLAPEWKGDVGMNDPSQSGPTYPFIAGMMNYLGGVSKGESYFTQLKSNGLVIHPTNGPTLQSLTSGQIKLALVQSSAGIGAVLGDHQLVVKYLNPVTLLPSAIGIDAKAPARRSCRPATRPATRSTTRS